ncbi:MAG: UDP-N-acetylglucosamine--N-acetylmuramyl-(pentapeptide) pyrophosphoryl-undecaprenol N-acetylglucosamine transferase, partial [Acidimicrobiia bacterium]
GHDRSSIRFIGAARGLEAVAVPAAGYEIELLALDGIQRSLAPRDIVRSVRAVARFVGALFTCVRTVSRLRPAVVVGVGGYASAPAVLAARALRIPTVIHEQNAVPGLVNRIAVRAGAQPLVAFPVARWPRATMTGNPVRREITAVTRRPVSPPRVSVVGGSQGAGRLNDVALGLYDRWRTREDVSVRHVAGPKHVDACRDRLATLRRAEDRLVYELVDFEPDMAELYASSSVLLARAGATTIAEASAVGIAAVFVPWSGAAQDQQTANVRTVVELGGALVVTDADCDVAHVEPILSELLADPDRLALMGAAARTGGHPDAASALGRIIESVARVPA